MLQQTQVKTVIPYWQRWLRHLPDVRALASARPDAVLKLWEGLGYYRRARNLRKAAQIIVHRRRLPETFDEWLALPGIGRYTAGAICSIAFNQPTPVLDGNVLRVLTRLFGIAENPRRKETNARLWELSQTLVRAAAQTQRTGELNCSHLNQALMELGAVTCTPRQPKCPLCPVRKFCVACRENRTDAIPNLGPPPASTKRQIAAFVVERRGRFLVRRRSAGVVNAHLWEFPNVELNGSRTKGGQLAEKVFAARPCAITPLHPVRHTITRYRIMMEVYRVAFASGMPRMIENGRWCSLSQLRRLAFPSAHRKILQMIKAQSKFERRIKFESDRPRARARPRPRNQAIGSRTRTTPTTRTKGGFMESIVQQRL
jgi:A/G-specific adenine glycosylase